MMVHGVENVVYNELGKIELANGKNALKVLEIDGAAALVRLFEASTGISLKRRSCAFWAALCPWASARGHDEAGCLTVWASPVRTAYPVPTNAMNGLPMNPAPAVSPEVYPDRRFGH